MSRKAKIAIRDPAPRVEQLKVEICNELKRAYRRLGWNQSQAALYSGACRQSMVYIDQFKVEKLTLGQLFSYLACAQPDFRILIAF